MAKTFADLDIEAFSALDKEAGLFELDKESIILFPTSDPDKPLGYVPDIFPPADIPEIADPKDIGGFPAKQVFRPRWDEFVDATARGIARVGSASSQFGAFLSSEGPPLTAPGMKPPEPFTQEQLALNKKVTEKLQKGASFLWELSKNPELASQNIDLASKALNLMGETIPYITATTAAYVTTGPLGAFTVGSMVEGNSAYRIAIDSGVEDTKAKKIGIGVGVISGAIEAFGGKYAEKLLKSAANKLKSKILKAGAVFGIGTVVEALEEGGQEIAQITGEETYRDVPWKERVSRVLSSMAGGGFLGGFMRGGSVAVRGTISAVSETAQEPITFRTEPTTEQGPVVFHPEPTEAEVSPTEAIPAPEQAIQPRTTPEAVEVAPEAKPEKLWGRPELKEDYTPRPYLKVKATIAVINKEGEMVGTKARTFWAYAKEITEGRNVFQEVTKEGTKKDTFTIVDKIEIIETKPALVNKHYGELEVIEAQPVAKAEPTGEPSAEFGESFLKRVTRQAEAGLRAGKEYGTPKSLLPLEKEVVSKLESAVKLSRKETAVIAKEKKAYQRQRVAQAHRFLKTEKAKGELTAQERLAATVKFFKGEQYAKQRWQPIDLDAATRDSMHEYIEEHKALGLHTKRDTSEALDKLFDGYYLAPYEVAYIANVFPELGKVAAKHRRPGNKGFDIFMSVLGLPKAFRAAYDISILGRQMYPLLLGKPSLIAPGTWQSLKLFWRKKSAEYATALSAEMRTDPAWQRAKDMGVEVIEPGELSEEFPTKIAGKIPGVARSERAFVQVGNLLRVAAHDMIENIYEARGKPLSDDASKSMAQAINDLSGRSAIPKSLKNLSLVASAVMWSPRLVLGRAKAPFRMFSGQQAARNLAIRSFTTMASLVTLLMLLGKYGHEKNEDIDGELNPISTDFGKIRYKNEHIDTTGGYGPMIRTVARTITGLTKTAAGEVIPKSRLETIKQFGRAKASPAVGIARKIITQKDWLGRPAFRPPRGTIGDSMTKLGIPDAAQIIAKEVYEEILPLPMVDVVDAAYIDGWASGIIATPLAFGGIGTLTYEQQESTKLHIEQNKIAQKRHGKNWDELGPLQQRFLRMEPGLLEQQLKADVEKLYQRQEYEIDKVRYRIYRKMPLSIRKELDNIGVAISAPARRSGDWKMSDKRYEYYIDKSTKLMQSAFKREFAKPYWQKKSTLLSYKQKRVNKIMTQEKAKARNEVKRLSNEGKL